MPVGLSADAGILTRLPFPSVSIFINKNHSKNIGSISRASSDANADPLIHSRLLENDDDTATLVLAYKQVRSLMTTEAMNTLLVEEIRPGSHIDGDDALEAYVKKNTELCYHFAGTCRMGIDENAVVTPELQVRGVENLWIADASIMPDLISGNTNAVCMMIGEKLGRYLSNNIKE